MNSAIQNYVDNYVVLSAQGLPLPNWLHWGQIPQGVWQSLQTAIQQMASLSPEDQDSVVQGAQQLYDAIVEPALALYVPKLLWPFVRPLAARLVKDWLIKEAVDYVFRQVQTGQVQA